MFLHEAKENLANGKKVARRAWPTGDFLIESPETPVDMDEDDAKDWKCQSTATALVPAGTLVYVADKGTKVLIGYELSYEDRSSSDWFIAD